MFQTILPKKTFYNLIADIIDSAPNKEMTVAEIYKKLENRFSNNRTDETWKNSVRHALSFKRVFMRIKSPRDNKKRGCLWTINEEFRDELNCPRRKRNYKAKSVLDQLSKNREEIKKNYYEAANLFLEKFYLNNK